MDPARQEPTRAAHFSLWDTVCIIVGIVIGTGIFKAPGSIFAATAGPTQALAALFDPWQIVVRPDVEHASPQDLRRRRRRTGARRLLSRGQG